MKKITTLFIFLFTVLIVQNLYAQSNIVQVDSAAVTVIEVRQFDTNSLNNYRNNEAFVYGAIVQTKESLWSKIKRWFWNKIGDLIGPGASLLSKIVFYGLLAFGLIGIFLYFSRVETSKIFRKGDYRQKLNAEILDENIDADNIVQLIQSSKKRGDFKLAIRYWLIQTLIQLESENVIQLDQNKTIAQYRKNFPIASLKSEFGELTKIFEYVWYGEYQLDSDQYDEIEDQFIRFLKSIQSD
jgi:hypothetical protein